MGRDMTEAWERHEKESNAYYAKRRKIRDAGLNPDELEVRSQEYARAKAHLRSVSHHQEIIQKYEADTDPKWEDF